MATWKPGPLVSAVRGTLGTVVFHGGRRANVIARVPITKRPTSKLQRTQQAALQAKLLLWESLSPYLKLMWYSGAPPVPLYSSIGTMRHQSTAQRFVAEALRLDPHALDITAGLFPVQLPRTPAPILEAAAFTQGGPYNITATPPDWTHYVEYLHIARWRQYGTRRAPGSIIYAGLRLRNEHVENWYTQALAAGADLQSGEQVRLTIYWIQRFHWSSPDVTLDLTVT
jgi:hypothetical protein